VTWVSAVTLTGTVAIDTGSGVGNITFNQTVNGSEDLTITAGTGDIDFNQSVGQLIRLDQLRIVSATDVSFAAAVSAQNFLQDAGSGTTTFGGMLNTSLAAGVNLTGTNLRVVSGITTTGNGEVLIVLSGSIPNGEAVFENGAHERGWACFHHGSGRTQNWRQYHNNQRCNHDHGHHEADSACHHRFRTGDRRYLLQFHY
jgi:hypothetical protein